jgi:arylsulfatase A-like enzyme
MMGAAWPGALAALALLCGGGPAAATDRKPNILFILADDLGYGDLGCYGQKRIRTPHLDALATSGIRFTSAYAGSTVCAPSRCALMTGRHTGRGLIRGNGRPDLALRPQDVTVAEVLKEAGYTTGAIGKWALGLEGSTGDPNRQGFDEWFGYNSQSRAHNYYPEFLNRNDGIHVIDENQGGRKGIYSHDFFTRAALNFIRDNWERPFFLYLAYTIPHANNELGRATGNGMEVPGDAPYSGEDWPQPEKNKAAMISRLDADIGRIVARLKELRIDDDTVIFFSSDNGPHKEGGVNPSFFASAGSLRGIKRDLYEGGIRVPMIVSWPGRIRAGVVSNFPWAFWDFLPTAAALAGIKPPEGLNGHSILPTLLGQRQDPAPFFYWEAHEPVTKQAVRMGNWKALRPAPGAPLELYNLAADPAESRNVASEHPDILARIEAYLESARTEDPNWPIKSAKATKK